MPWHIRAKSLLWLTILLVVARPAAADVSAACEAYGRAEAVFVGRHGVNIANLDEKNLHIPGSSAEGP
jgi:hypothetical protein